MMFRAIVPPLLLLALLSHPGPARGGAPLDDDFRAGISPHWQVKEGAWAARDGRATAEGGFSRLILNGPRPHDFELIGDVGYSHDEAHAAAGLMFRLDADATTGYAVGLREIEKGTSPEFGPWERPVVQLFRLDRDGWKVLQESKIMGARSGLLRRLKVVCVGPNIWVYDQDMTTPVFKEYDDRYDRPGLVGLWKDQRGVGLYDNVRLSDVTATPQSAPSRTDWSWARGAVYVRSDAVNSAQMWHDYWPHVDVADRELSYAAEYGFNMVQVYLHWIVWDRHKDEYLKRIDDFLSRASKYGLKVNLVLWDDCGHVEPSLTFSAPVRGRHNSQMMPNPSHAIRDSEAALTAHRDRFRDYVESVARRFKDDPRISFWQLYNEAMGAKERYRVSETDANINRLMGWTREWVKGTGTLTPVTATGGGFYGPKYSDFYTYHSYGFGKAPLPNADGGPEHLCTETLNRPDFGVDGCLHDLAGKRNGFVVWELMIGRDNCRFPWGHEDGPDEPRVPFHGVIYPDGHPWDVDEIKALLGPEPFATLEDRVFRVGYVAGWTSLVTKSSITPRIDFDLGDEPGTGSIDASARLGETGFSAHWAARLVAPETGPYTFFAETDGRFRLRIGDALVIDKGDFHRREVQGGLILAGGREYAVKVEYVHGSGPASAHLSWSGPHRPRAIFQPGLMKPASRASK